MPLYEFICEQCQHEQELLVRGTETPQCESCGGQSLQKLLSVPAAHAARPGSSEGPPPGSCGSGCGCFPG